MKTMPKGLRRMAWWLLVLWMITGLTALAEAPDGWLDALNDTERTLLYNLADAMELEHTDENLWPLYHELFDQSDAEGMVGWLTDDTYTHPDGFQLFVPYGWSILEHEEDVTVALMAETDELGYATMLRVSLAPAETPLEMAQAVWQQTLSQKYPDFQLLSLDALTYHGVPAVEIVFQYTNVQGHACVQQRFDFQEEGTAYTICLDMLSSNASNEDLLLIYDTFLQRFTVGV